MNNLNKLIDHTILKPDATIDDIRKLCIEAKEYGFYSVCVNSAYVNVAYKNWDLTAFFQGTYGNEIFAGAKYQFYFNPDYNHLVDALDSWTPTNTNASLPIAKTDNYNGGNSLPSSFYIEDGSYFRCKNLQIGYTFDSKLLKKTGFIQSARLFAGVTNLFTITSYSLYDPEVSSNTLFNRGVDGLDNASPTINSRTYNFGFNLTF